MKIVVAPDKFKGSLPATQVAAVLGATRRPGIELVLDLAGFDAALNGANLVITGEGSLDADGGRTGSPAAPPHRADDRPGPASRGGDRGMNVPADEQGR